jgi:hypothetical protein
MSTGGLSVTSLSALDEFKGSLDVISVKAEKLNELSPAARQRSSGPVSLQDVTQRNKRIK